MSEPGYRFHRVAATSEIREGEGLRVTLGEWEIAVFNIEGEFYAIDDVCTHAYASLSEGFVEGAIIECPLHSGRFEIKTGRAVAAPCTIDLRTYVVRREDDSIFVGIPVAE